jgi:hypothetical protein
LLGRLLILGYGAGFLGQLQYGGFFHMLYINWGKANQTSLDDGAEAAPIWPLSTDPKTRGNGNIVIEE